MSLYPRRLLSTVVRQAADNIIEVATNSSQLSLSPNRMLADISFSNSFKRMMTNKILMFNVLSAMFVQTAVVNFFYHEQDYLQARFFLASDDSQEFRNEWTTRILTTLLKPPLVALSVLVAGLIIAKASPNPRYLICNYIILKFQRYNIILTQKTSSLEYHHHHNRRSAFRRFHLYRVPAQPDCRCL